MQKKFLRTFAMSVVLISLGACIYSQRTYAMDGDEFDRVVRPGLPNLSCFMTTHATKNEVISSREIRRERLYPWHLSDTVTKEIEWRTVPDTKRQRTCVSCGRYYPFPLTMEQLKPKFKLKRRGAFQTLKIWDNKAANKRICAGSINWGEMGELMKRAKIRRGSTIPMKTALERLWRATRPSTIPYRIENEDCDLRYKQLDEHSPLCTPDCDVLKLIRMIPPIEERKTTSCCCCFTLS